MLLNNKTREKPISNISFQQLDMTIRNYCDFLSCSRKQYCFTCLHTYFITFIII